MAKLNCFKYGERFGRLIILEEVPNENKKRRFLCKCDCGNLKEAIGSDLRNGNTKSCGCLAYENLLKRNYKHGGSFHESYTNWREMQTRCYIVSSPSYLKYGGSGIFVCRRWRKNFWAFVKDIGKKPSEEHTVDRIDNNGPYAPWNCRWATKKEQARNRNTNRNIFYRNKTKCLTDWSKYTGISKETLRIRIENHGIKFAFEEPVLSQEKRIISFNNKTKTLKDWSIYLDIPYTTLYNRLYRQNLSIEDSFCDSKRFKFLKVQYNGKTQSLRDWSIELGINYDTLRHRLNSGKTAEEALTNKDLRKKD